MNPFKGLSDDEAKALVIWALNHESFSETVAICDLRNVLIDSAREKFKPPEGVLAPPGRSAYLKIRVDDRIVLALKNPPDNSPYVFLLTAVPTQALEKARSSIIRPGEVQ